MSQECNVEEITREVDELIKHAKAVGDQPGVVKKIIHKFNVESLEAARAKLIKSMHDMHVALLRVRAEEGLDDASKQEIEHVLQICPECGCYRRMKEQERKG
jgi:hypothetical protein